MKGRISRSAERDFAAGFRFYEEQERSLDAYFLESPYTDIESLHLHGGIHRKEGRYHRCHAKCFPYAIYYFLDGEVVNIRAVLDSRRAPTWIHQRLRDPS